MVELRVVKRALEAKGFCDAWEGMLTTLTEYGITVSDREKMDWFKGLRNAANDYGGRYFCHKNVNGPVRRAHSSTSPDIEFIVYRRHSSFHQYYSIMGLFLLMGQT